MQSPKSENRFRALQRDDVILRAAVDDITKHVATVDMCTQPYGTQHPVPKRGIAKGDQFYAIHDQAIVGWNNSTNPPVDRNGLPLVDIVTNSVVWMFLVKLHFLHFFTIDCC
jgi:hypothetical protein